MFCSVKDYAARRLRWIALLGVSLLLVFGSVRTDTEAAVSYKYNGVDYSPVFNYSYFAKKYPSIISTYGGDQKKVFTYFVTQGVKKGLQGSSNFDVTSYAYRYSDTRHRFKNDLAQYYIHYCTIGYPKLHRKGTGTTKMVGYATELNGKNYASVYNYNDYVLRKPGLKTKYGFDDQKVLEYFVSHDYIEKTVDGTTYQVKNDTLYIQETNDLCVRFLGDNGISGECALIESNGHYLLVDASNPGEEDLILEKLKEYNALTLDVYLSHYHKDHYGSMVKLLSNRMLKIGTLYLPDYHYLMDVNLSNCSSSYRRSTYLDNRKNCEWLIDIAKSRGITIKYLKQGSAFSFGICSVNVLWGCNYKSSVLDDVYMNSNSLVSRFSVRGSINYLHCGDIQSVVQDTLVKSGISLSSNFFSLPHHGFNSGCWTDFLAAVKPIYMYYNAPDDEFGQDPQVSTFVSKAVAKGNVFSRSVNGDVTFVANKGKIAAYATANVSTVNSDVIKNGLIYRRYLKFNKYQKKRFIYPKQTSK